MRKWLRDVLKKLDVNEKLPKDPQVDKEFLQAIGYDQEFLSGMNTIGDLWKKLTEARNRIVHYFLSDDNRPLHFSHGKTYSEYSLASGALLYHSNIALNELLMFFNKNLSSKLARGSILPMKENKESYRIQVK